MSSKIAMRSNRPKNLFSMVLIMIVIAMLVVVVQVNSISLREKKETYDKREAYLLEQIANEEKRTEEIEEYRKYTQTKQYMEDLAKSRLGLVYKDEIILEAGN